MRLRHWFWNDDTDVWSWKAGWFLLLVTLVVLVSLTWFFAQEPK